MMHKDMFSQICQKCFRRVKLFEKNITNTYIAIHKIISKKLLVTNNGQLW